MSKYNKEELEQLILVDKMSYQSIGKIYGCTGSNIKKVSERLGIDLPKKRKINDCETFNKGTGKKTFCLNCQKEISHQYKNLYCSTDCHFEHQSSNKYNHFLANPIEYQRSNFNPNVIKKFIIKEQNNKCAICDQGTSWNNKPLVLILDHIDGNAANNTRDNFRCVCPNCDSQLDTYKSKNKNSARITRYKSKPEV